MGFGSSVKTVFGSLSRAHAAQNAYMELSNMSDESLASRGLKRQDIARVAFQNIIDV